MTDDYTKRLTEEIGSILTSGEQVLAVSTQNAINSPLNRDSVVVTNRRLILYHPKLLGRMDLQDFLWQDVTDLSLASKVLGAVITVQAKKRLPDGQVRSSTASIDGLEKASARRLYALAQELEEQWREKNRVRQMEEERARSGGVYLGGAGGPTETPRASIEERLEKLRSLREKGLISDAEYESRKSQIIAEL